jgi:hypothetical protein
MKKKILGGIVAAAALGLAVAAPGTANASWFGYGTEGDHSGAAYHAQLVEDAGTTTGSPSKAADLAVGICQMRTGHSRNDMLRLLEPTYGSKAAIAVVMGAEYHFCPAHDAHHQQDEGGVVDATHPYVPVATDGSDG